MVKDTGIGNKIELKFKTSLIFLYINHILGIPDDIKINLF